MKIQYMRNIYDAVWFKTFGDAQLKRHGSHLSRQCKLEYKSAKAYLNAYTKSGRRVPTMAEVNHWLEGGE